MEVDQTKSFGEGTPKVLPDLVDNLGKMKKPEEEKYTAEKSSNSRTARRNGTAEKVRNYGKRLGHERGRR